MTNGDIVVIAAHSDDAALCLGGFLFQSPNPKKIVNVFSTCACTIDTSLISYEDITKKNNQEEELFAIKVNAQLSFLRHKEVLLRGYKRWTGAIEKSDNYLVFKITRQIENLIKQNDNLFFPIGIGDHIDHKILFEIGRNLTADYQNIYFYEDLPYAAEISPQSLNQTLSTFKHPILIDISNIIDHKIQLCQIYKTQYDPSYLDVIKNYANKIKTGFNVNKFYERIWRL